MDKKHRFAVGAGFRLSPSQKTGSRGPEPYGGRLEIVDLVADVVQTAAGMFFQKTR